MEEEEAIAVATATERQMQQHHDEQECHSSNKGNCQAEGRREQQLWELLVFRISTRLEAATERSAAIAAIADKIVPEIIIAVRTAAEAQVMLVDVEEHHLQRRSAIRR